MVFTTRSIKCSGGGLELLYNNYITTPRTGTMTIEFGSEANCVFVVADGELHLLMTGNQTVVFNISGSNTAIVTFESDFMSLTITTNGRTADLSILAIG